jgi:hypothetical protein
MGDGSDIHNPEDREKEDVPSRLDIHSPENQSRPGIQSRWGIHRPGSLSSLDSPVAGRLALDNRKQDSRRLGIGTLGNRRSDNRNKCPVAVEA